MRFIADKIELPKGPYKRCLLPGEESPNEKDRFRFDNELIGRCVCLGPASESKWLYSITLEKVIRSKITSSVHAVPYEENERLYAGVIANNYTDKFQVTDEKA